MADKPTRLDTRAELRFLGLKEIGTRADGKWVRLVLVAPDKAETLIHLAAELLQKMLPNLIAAADEAERKREGGNKRTVYRIEQGNVQSTEEGGVVLDFITPTGQHLAFEMDRMGTTLLCASLSRILESLGEADQTPDAPPDRRH